MALIALKQGWIALDGCHWPGITQLELPTESTGQVVKIQAGCCKCCCICVGPLDQCTNWACYERGVVLPEILSQ